MKKITVYSSLLFTLLIFACGPSDERKKKITDTITEQSIKTAKDEMIKPMDNVDPLHEKTESIKKSN